MSFMSRPDPEGRDGSKLLLGSARHEGRGYHYLGTDKRVWKNEEAVLHDDTPWRIRSLVNQ